MSFLKSLDISASALSAQRFRMDVISENIANADVTRTASGQPYRRRVVVMGEKSNTKSFSQVLDNSTKLSIGNGVEITKVIEDTSPFKLEYDPSHPDADENGYVNYPNVEIVTEMVDLISASRSYEANITAFNTSKAMAIKSLEIGR